MTQVQADAAAELPDEPQGIPLTTPFDGLPPLIDTAEALDAAVAALAAGHGPIAADAERASGFRYGQATYLVQFKRAGAGLFLIDTAALPDLSSVHRAVGDAEFVFHAASQDLPGMHALGIFPARIFDTELAARLLGWPKVGLGAVIERELGYVLAKEHSAQDWSIRPLPEAWLNYAALDVELLIELRDAMAAHLEHANKLDWALQEFEAVRTAPPPEPRVDPWRRVAGTHLVRDARGLGIVRALWQEREQEAQRRDVTPGRILRDAAIVAAAKAKPTSLDALLAVPEWQTKGTKRAAPRWWPVVESAMRLPDAQLPAKRAPQGDGPPPPRAWAEKRPEAATRLALARAALSRFSETLEVPVENLAQPDAVRRVCWDGPAGHDAIAQALAARGVRPWQLALVSPLLAKAFADAEAGVVPPPVLASTHAGDESSD